MGISPKTLHQRLFEISTHFAALKALATNTFITSTQPNGLASTVHILICPINLPLPNVLSFSYLVISLKSTTFFELTFQHVRDRTQISITPLELDGFGYNSPFGPSSEWCLCS